jgi:DNA-directed RNA polymerase specialized sigma24 family protein
LIVAAGGQESTAARYSISLICEIYWYPIYAYIRRHGSDAEDARDLTQAFLASLLERRDFSRVRRERGRFRSFLLASLQHFLANETARRRTQKRGGEVVVVPLSLNEAEGRYHVEPTDLFTPETLFERRWALALIDHVLRLLRQEWEVGGRDAEFDELKAALLGEAPAGGYAAIADKLGTTEGAVKAAVHRLRRRFQALLRHEIAGTVTDPADVDDEIRYLLRALQA